MVFAVLMVLFQRGLRHPSTLRRGTLFLTYLVGYGTGRFWIEGLRMDSLMLGPLRIAQVVSLVEVVVGLAGLVWLYGQRRDLPDEDPGRSRPGSPIKNPEGFNLRGKIRVHLPFHSSRSSDRFRTILIRVVRNTVLFIAFCLRVYRSALGPLQIGKKKPRRVDLQG
jgi:Prolipoprotein diacylglyceryl transferase